MKWNFLYQITAASRTPDKGGYHPQIPVLSVLFSQLNLLNPPPEIPKALQNRAKLNPIVKTVKNCWI